MSHRAITEYRRHERQRVNRQSRDLGYLFAPILRAIGDEVLTPLEVVERLPMHRAKDVRRALLILHDDEVLTRVTDSTSVLYARSSTPEEG